MANKKSAPALLRCTCGNSAVTVKTKAGRWETCCISYVCGRRAYGATASEAAENWNKEVQKHADTAGKRH